MQEYFHRFCICNSIMIFKATHHLSSCIRCIFLLTSISDLCRSRVLVRKDELTSADVAVDEDYYCADVKKSEIIIMENFHLNPICINMAPRSGRYQAEPTSTSPWKIYTYKPEIQQYFSHPVVLGSDDGKEKFVNYMIAAKSVEGGHFVGHFEYQWDAIPICCYSPDKNYSYEGHRLQPNLLVGAQGVRVQTANQTVLWTAPRFFEGIVVFVYVGNILEEWETVLGKCDFFTS